MTLKQEALKAYREELAVREEKELRERNQKLKERITDLEEKITYAFGRIGNINLIPEDDDGIFIVNIDDTVFEARFRRFDSFYLSLVRNKCPKCNERITVPLALKFWPDVEAAREANKRELGDAYVRSPNHSCPQDENNLRPFPQPKPWEFQVGDRLISLIAEILEDIKGAQG